MPTAVDPGHILALLRDPNVESQEIAAATGAPREEAARAARLVLGIAKAKAEDLLTLPPPLALAAARAALEAGRGDLLAALAAHPSRDVVKEAKRALHLLKSRGVSVPEPTRPPRPAPPPPAPEPVFPCFASGVDGHGERALWITRSVAGKGIEVAQAVLSDVSGLVELQVGLLGRKEFRTFAKDLLERGRPMGVGEIDPGLARSLAAAARRLNDASGKEVPAGADAWLARLGPADPPPDPAARFEPLPEAEERAAVEGSGALHELPMLRGWLADEEYLRGVAAKLDEIAVSPLYVDERQRAEQTLHAVAAAAEGYLEGERRQRLASRLFAAAAHLSDLGDAANARVAAATARAVAGGAPASRIPFARQLVEKGFPGVKGPGAAEEPAATGPASPLIVAPR